LRPLPKIETHARIYFRHLTSHKKADAIQEMRALAWRSFVRLIERGKDAAEFIVSFCRFLPRAVNSGRRVTGMEKSKDVLSLVAQQRRGFTVRSLPEHGLVNEEAFADALTDNTVTPVPEQVAFRQDFRRWRRRLTRRNPAAPLVCLWESGQGESR
jgi:hypothetical protein